MNSRKRDYLPWIVMSCLGLCSAACYGAAMILFSFFTTGISQELHTSISTLSYYFTIIVLVMAVIMPFLPKILKKLNTKFLYTAISCIVTLIFFLMSTFNNIYMYFISAIILGICVSFLTFVPVGIILDNWFVEKKGLAVGICWGISSVFNFIFAPIFSNLITQLGYRKSFVILAIIVGVISIPSALFGIHFDPEQLGRKPYGYNRKLLNKNNEQACGEISNKDLLHSPAFWILGVMIVLLQFPAVFLQLIPTFAVKSGFSLATGGFMVSAAMIADIILNLVIGASFDKIGSEKASLGWFILILISYLSLSVATQIHSTSLAICGAAINDTMYVYLGTGITALASSLLGKRAFAKGFSLVSSISFFLGAFGMPVNTGIAELTGGYAAVLGFWSIIVVIMFILTLVGMKHHFE